MIYFTAKKQSWIECIGIDMLRNYKKRMVRNKITAIISALFLVILLVAMLLYEIPLNVYHMSGTAINYYGESKRLGEKIRLVVKLDNDKVINVPYILSPNYHNGQMIKIVEIKTRLFGITRYEAESF
jgi:hypothetical protein